MIKVARAAIFFEAGNNPNRIPLTIDASAGNKKGRFSPAFLTMVNRLGFSCVGSLLGMLGVLGMLLCVLGCFSGLSFSFSGGSSLGWSHSFISSHSGKRNSSENTGDQYG
jgi:hypothetical protein